MDLGRFINKGQLRALYDLCLNSEEKDFFEEKRAELQSIVDSMPQTGATDGQGMAAIVYLHYFVGSSHFFVTERDVEEEQLQAFGYACLNGDWEMAELGYICIEELLSIGAELDFYWTPKPLAAAITEKRGF